MTTLENLVFIWMTIFEDLKINIEDVINGKASVNFNISILTSHFHLRRATFVTKMIYERIKNHCNGIHIPNMDISF